MLYTTIALLVFAYIVGSIPFGLIIGKVFYKTDIRTLGSGNIGFTNMYRNFGPVTGIAVLVMDILKGLIPVLIAKHFMAPYPIALPTVAVIVGLTAILGHCYSMFLGFSGGKGMATAGGLVIALWPWVGLILFTMWVIILATTRYSSLASLTLAVTLPIFVSILYPKTEYIVYSIIAALILIYRHRSNIARLLAGKELKLGKEADAEEG